MPDLGLVLPDGRRTAIEVELQPKSRDRLGLILGGYRELIRAGQLTDVSYVVDRQDVADLVRCQAEAALLAETLQIGPLADIVSSARTRGVRIRAERSAA